MVQQVVYFGVPFAPAVEALALPEIDKARFMSLAQEELRNLEPYNCARYRLPIRKTQEWIRQGRPGLAQQSL